MQDELTLEQEFELACLRLVLAEMPRGVLEQQFTESLRMIFQQQNMLTWQAARLREVYDAHC